MVVIMVAVGNVLIFVVVVVTESVVSAILLGVLLDVTGVPD